LAKSQTGSNGGEKQLAISLLLNPRYVFSATFIIGEAEKQRIGIRNSELDTKY
jgi:hypothetical protein